mgnify:CR=1 FL=1
MKEVIELKVSSYTEYPGPRYIKQGENSGEKFYNDYLSKKFSQAISENKLLNVNLDGTAGYASSFIDEVFGNLLKDFEYKLILE